jgi:outer membrane protein assembly factor BamD (BamD/ComL family)
LYRQAEIALRRGDDARGQQLLSELVSRFAADPAADAARFELALIFERAGKLEKAIALTGEIVRGGGNGPFAEPSLQMLIKLHVAAGHCEPAANLAKTYLAKHPEGPFAAHIWKVIADCAGK